MGFCKRAQRDWRLLSSSERRKWRKEYNTHLTAIFGGRDKALTHLAIGRIAEVGSEGQVPLPAPTFLFLFPQAKLQGHVEPLRKHLEAVQKMKAKEERRVTELKVGECPRWADGYRSRGKDGEAPHSQVVTRSPEEGQPRPGRGLDAFPRC